MTSIKSPFILYDCTVVLDGYMYRGGVLFLAKSQIIIAEIENPNLFRLGAKTDTNEWVSRYYYMNQKMLLRKREPYTILHTF